MIATAHVKESSRVSADMTEEQIREEPGGTMMSPADKPRYAAQAPGLQKQPPLSRMLFNWASLSTSLHPQLIRPLSRIPPPRTAFAGQHELQLVGP